jgi:hypothetical protein
MKTSALDCYFDLYADELDHEKKQLLARLPDNAVEQAHAAFFGDAGMLGPPDNDEDLRARMRTCPALAVLSDAELDLALEVATKLFAEAMAAEEYIAETHEYMTEAELKRMSNIARWVA